jgi:hypothetical protein
MSRGRNLLGEERFQEYHPSHDAYDLGPFRSPKLGGPIFGIRGWTMRLWLLSFGVTAVIMRAESLAHARLLAAVKEPGRARLFDDGFPVDPKFERKIPDDFVGPKLTREEASDLLRLLGDGPRSDDARPNQHARGLTDLTV